ncbi:hypothetical protein A4A58_18445 [Tardiphaga robiniae]|uniref:Uncharacterized protein n=2 Tax=Tardiphaga robiniae TaxID=943830 RepID=A0A163XC75_9BRAD|nr:hypothetical protein A4A58_18445 [Tardiphaga robiniae]
MRTHSTEKIMTTQLETTRQRVKRMVTRELAAFERRENEINAEERRERARALGLPLSLSERIRDDRRTGARSMHSSG